VPLNVEVNGRMHSVKATQDTPLLYVLRDELAQCGACTVMLGDGAIRSCVTPVGTVTGKKITTLEGLGTPAKPHPLQTALIEEQAFQCGYCVSAMTVGAAAFLKQGVFKADTSDAKIAELMNQYLCRCGSHFRILAAIKRAAKEMGA
jgi:nicotinate dehydrogenase subunit A